MKRYAPKEVASKIANKGSRQVWSSYLLVGILFTGVYFLLPSRATQNVFFDLVGYSAVVAVLIGARMHRPTRPLQWYVFALGLLLLVLGDTTWTYYENVLLIEDPFPSIADVFYLSGLPCLAGGLVLMFRRRISAPRWAEVVNALIIATVAGMLSWIFLISPLAHDQTQPLLKRLISVAYPLADLLLLVAVLRLLFISAKRLAAHYLLSASLLSLLIADTAYAAAQLTDTYQTGDPLDAGWLLNYVLFGAAALHPSMVGLSEPIPEGGTRPMWWRLVLLTGASLMAPLMLAYQATFDDHIDAAPIVGSSIALCLLVAARIALLIGERRRMEQQLEHQAFHDPLTNLPNRLLFVDRLEHALVGTPQKEGQLAILFMDLDNFKVINDSLGHKAGDEVLKAVAGRLQNCSRSEDTVARFGGDEFALLVEDVAGLKMATSVAKRTLQALRDPFVLGGCEVFVSASIGIVLAVPGEDRGVDELLRDADLAMYRAKNGGKAQYEVFEEDLRLHAFGRLKAEADLRRALGQGEFKILYQPMVSLTSGSIVGFEALLRWKHPERGSAGTSEFIPVAEEVGLILPIGRLVLEEVCSQARIWRDRYPDSSPPMVSVNFSVRQFQSSDIASYLAQLLRETGLPSNALCLEITESVAMEDAPSTISTFKELKGLGLRLAIDDFGTGYSSLSYLKRFPVDYLKIDRSFVDGLGRGAEDTIIASGIISLAHSLGLQVVAEGVERDEQLTLLREMRCDKAQGHYFSKPLSSEEAEKLLAKGSVL